MVSQYDSRDRGQVGYRLCISASDLLEFAMIFAVGEL